MLKTTTRYAIKRNGQYMVHYENMKAEWCYAVDGAWLTPSKETAQNFSSLIKYSSVVELTIIERSLKKEVTE